MGEPGALRRWWERLLDRIQPDPIGFNYRMGNYRDVIWLFGDGRSGTTWVSDLINWDKSYREMFEPFHPRFVGAMQGLTSHLYIRPGDAAHPFSRAACDVFTGRFTDERVDQANHRRWYRGLLIKDVFANLFACWAARQFPDMKLVLLVRHPFAVALSKFKTKHWHWMTEPSELLRQEHLVDDHLRPFEDVIKSVGDDYIERQVLIWAILHYVPFVQFDPDRLRVVFYEEIVRYPERELPGLFHYLKPHLVDRMTKGALGVLTLPSRVGTTQTRKADGKWPIGRWKAELSPDQVERGLRILAHFGLDQLYGDGFMPRREFLPCRTRRESGIEPPTRAVEHCP